jgi:hypothetical protein
MGVEASPFYDPALDASPTTTRADTPSVVDDAVMNE